MYYRKGRKRMKKILLALILLLNFNVVDAIAPLDEEVTTTTIIEENYDRPVSKEEETEGKPDFNPGSEDSEPMPGSNGIEPEEGNDEYMEPTLYIEDSEQELSEDMIKITAVSEEASDNDLIIYALAGTTVLAAAGAIYFYIKSKK
jgi:hypothetical protein